jgi:hypothetical protein
VHVVINLWLKEFFELMKEYSDEFYFGVFIQKLFLLYFNFFFKFKFKSKFEFFVEFILLN